MSSYTCAICGSPSNNMECYMCDRDVCKKCMNEDEHCTDCQRIEKEDTVGTKPTHETKWLFSGSNYTKVSGIMSDELPPGFYRNFNNRGVEYLVPIEVNSEKVVSFPNTTSDEVMQEIETFQAAKDRYERYGITYKRGILMYGQQGTGKSSILREIVQRGVSQGYFAINFLNPGDFERGFNLIRSQYPDTLILAIMEDIDTIIGNYGEHQVLEILDGVNKMDNVVYLATTNHPDKLGARIINRPSRFDRRFKIGLPSLEVRQIFINYLFSKESELELDLEELAAKTSGFTLAHLKELFLSMAINGFDPQKSFDVVNNMREDIPEEDYLDAGELRKRQKQREAANSLSVNIVEALTAAAS